MTLTSDLVCPHAFQIFNIFVLLSSDCSTRLHRSVITYWCSALDDVAPAVIVAPAVDVAAAVAVATADDDDEAAGSPLIPSFRNNASTSCAHVVSAVMPDIHRCSPCTQMGISSSEPTDNDSSLISLVDCDATEIDAIDPNDELDDDVDNEHRIGYSVLWLRYCERLFACSFLQ